MPDVRDEKLHCLQCFGSLEWPLIIGGHSTETGITLSIRRALLQILIAQLHIA
jgi:hypothetical protein